MEKVSLLLEETINENLVRVIISNKRKSMEIQKVVIHPFLKNDKLLFQFEAFRGKQVFHDNREKQDAVCEMFRLLSEDFKQMEMETKTEKITVLVSKKGKATIRRKQEIICNQVKDLSHNRKKEYLLPAKDVPFLVELGITTRDGKVIDKKYKKYRQINRFLEFIQDILPKLPKNKKLTIVDFGCGKSYLTFAMYYYLKIQQGYELQMIGLDLKEDVISHCNELAKKLGYDELFFCKVILVLMMVWTALIWW